ncbi:MAG: pyridoxal phosphate-dependent aminotransferase, partial [Lachnospiraceae bacterium]
MLIQKYVDMLSAKSVIRTLAEFAAKRGQEIGYENVFDYSLGNPSVPVPEEFTQTCIRLLTDEPPGRLHGYSQSLGIYEVREKVARSLNQ